MYVSLIISLFSGIFISSIFFNKLELILTHILIPIINYINNKPYKLKLVHFIEESNQEIEESNQEIEELNQEIEESNQEIEESNQEIEESNQEIEEDKEGEEEEECMNQTEYDENINKLLNKINSLNKKKIIFLDENLD